MEQNYLSLLDVFKIIKRRVLVLLLVTVLTGAGAYGLSAYVIAPRYTATATLYVYSGTDTDAVTAYDLSAAKGLVRTYAVLLKSDSVLDKVMAGLERGPSTTAFRKNFTAVSLDETETLSISYTDKDPLFAQTVVNKVLDVAPAEIVPIVQVGGIRVVDYAKVPLLPASPNIVLNTLVGALLGFFVTLGVSIVMRRLDTRIHDEEALKSFNVPIIGRVPTIFK